MTDIYTDAGEELTADIMDGTIAAPTWKGAWGTGAGVSAKTDATLFTEAAEARVNSVNSQPASNQNELVVTMTSLSAQTITNAGIFDAASGGNMLLKTDFTGIALGIGDKIELTHTLTWS